MKIQILGAGCPKCTTLTQNAEAAVKELGINCNIEKVTDMDQIISFGVMLTPALAIDGDVKSAGKVLTIQEILEILQNKLK